MTRKGNCLDNSVMENFFGILKAEMFYGFEWKCKILTESGYEIGRVHWLRIKYRS